MQLLNVKAAPVCQFFPFLGKIQQFIIDSDQLKQIPKNLWHENCKKESKSLVE